MNEMDIKKIARKIANKHYPSNPNTGVDEPYRQNRINVLANSIETELKNHKDLHNVTQWVATLDKLPEESKVVIVWLPIVKDTDLDKIDEHTTAEEFKRHYSHWMEYPEPPCG